MNWKIVETIILEDKNPKRSQKREKICPIVISGEFFEGNETVINCSVWTQCQKIESANISVLNMPANSSIQWELRSWIDSLLLDVGKLYYNRQSLQWPQIIPASQCTCPFANASPWFGQGLVTAFNEQNVTKVRNVTSKTRWQEDYDIYFDCPLLLLLHMCIDGSELPCYKHRDGEAPGGRN